MKIFKRILLGILALVVIVLITALFVKKDYSVSRSVIINKPKAEVFEYVRFLKNQNDYSKWARMDPAMKKTYSGTDGTPGFVSAWESDKSDVGAGEQEIKKIIPGERIDYEIRFKKPWSSTCAASLSTTGTGEAQTEVTWGFEGHMPYPMNVMRLFMNMDKMIGDDLQAGLNTLKAVQEK